MRDKLLALRLEFLRGLSYIDSFTELGQLSGVAAVLRFPLPEIEDSDEDNAAE